MLSMRQLSFSSVMLSVDKKKKQLLHCGTFITSADLCDTFPTPPAPSLVSICPLRP